MHIRSISKVPAKAALPTEVADTGAVFGVITAFLTMFNVLFQAMNNGRTAINGFKS